MQNLVSSSTRTSVTNVPVQFYSVSCVSLFKFLIRKTWLQPEKDFEEWLNYEQSIESWLDKVSSEDYIE